MIITIDGPAGSGKSAAAQLLARKLGIQHLDTGAMYRAVALDAIEQGIIDNPSAIARRARRLHLAFDFSVCPAQLKMDGRNVSENIRRPDVTQWTCVAADNPSVRTELVQRQRQIAAQAGSLVAEGRDQGTVVFPGAEYKFYLDADIRERARRRTAQLRSLGISADERDVLPQLQQRDACDRNRPTGALVMPSDAIVIDTTSMSLEEVVAAMISRLWRSVHP